MQKGHKIPLLAGILLGAVFVGGVIQLFQLRFSLGDIYPAYSSLRADPLGARVLYKSFTAMPDLKTSRNLDPSHKLKADPNAVLLVLGLEPPGQLDSFLPEMQRETLEDLDRFTRLGGRLVISFAPQNESSDIRENRRAEEGNKAEPELRKRERRLERDKTKPMHFSLKKSWGMVFKNAQIKDLSNLPQAELSPEAESIALPAAVACDTSLYFDRLAPEWQVIYLRDNHPVFIKRKLGRGEIILSASSYFLSNEAMLRERHPTLLAWLVGGAKEVIFDEYHHGVARDPGIVSLARKYHLHGVAACLILLAALFIWKNASSLVPPREQSLASFPQQTAKGRDAASGIINLLRKNIPARNVLNVCVEEWKKSMGRNRQVLPSKEQRVEEILSREQQLPINQKNPVAAYNAICRILAEK